MRFLSLRYSADFGRSRLVYYKLPLDCVVANTIGSIKVSGIEYRYHTFQNSGSKSGCVQCLMFLGPMTHIFSGEPFTQEELDEMLNGAVDAEKGVINYKDYAMKLAVDDADS